jgi:hypothetical protein
MTIDVPQQKTLYEWLSAKGVREDCPACGSYERMVGDIVAPPAAPGGGGTSVGGPSFLLAQVICRNCGFVMHFASTLIGRELQSPGPGQEPLAEETR